MGKDRPPQQLSTDEGEPLDKAIGKVGKPDFGNLLSGKDSLDALRNWNTGMGGIAGPDGSGLIHSLGLHGLEIKADPFHKDYNDPKESSWESTWRGIKGAFGFHDTVEDKIRDREISHLTPDQKKEYDKEEDARRAWETRASLVGKPPEMPMHDLVNQRVAQFEKDIREKVLAGLTPEQRKEMEEEGKKWDEEYKKIHAHDNPYGGPLAQPKDPPLGPMTTYYEAECKKRAEEELRK